MDVLNNDMHKTLISVNNNEYDYKIPILCSVNNEMNKLCKEMELYKEKCIKRGWMKDDIYRWLSSNQPDLIPDNNQYDKWKVNFLLRSDCVLTNDKIRLLVNRNLAGEKGGNALWENIPIEFWDTSEVTDMSALFLNAREFNQDISGWDVSKVNIMDNMFEGASVFNQPIGKWNVSNVEIMNNMFQGAREFDQPIGNWNVSNVEEMGSMFEGASKFNQDISEWNVSNVVIMNNMFAGAESFNQDIRDWDVSSVAAKHGIFYNSGISKENKPNFRRTRR